MTNYAHELFLLSSNLAQFKDKNLVLNIFIESLLSIFPEHDFKWSTGAEVSFEEKLTVCTKSKIFGFVYFNNVSLFTDETYALLQNAGQLLAMILENIEREKLLNDQTEHLRLLVDERTQQLSESEEQFKLFLEHSPVFVFLKDENVRTIRLSKNYEKMLGMPVEEILGKTMDDIFPSDLAKQMIADDRAVIREGKAIEIVEELNGRVFETTKFPIKREGRPAILGGFTMDITERKHAEEALLQSEENLRVTLNSIGDAVIATDTKGRVTQMNPVAEYMTGWAVADARGKPLPEVFYIINAETRTPSVNPAEKVLATGEVVGLANHTILVARDKREFKIADSGAPILSDAGDITGVVLVFRDVTEEYAMQEKLNQSQKLDAIGKLAGGIAHDFNNMLGGIMGGVQLLKKRMAADTKNDKFLSIIMDSAERAGELTNKLLTFSKRQEPLSVPLDLHLAISEVISLLENTIDKRIKIEFDLVAEPSMVLGESSQLQNAFLNLGINASHAMPKGGTISFSSKIIELSSAHCSASTFDLTPGTYIEVSVRDTGCGINQKDMLHIFDPFFTTKGQSQGTGLGLSTTYGTVQQHSGSITVYSEIDKGTCFYIMLPLTNQIVSNQVISEKSIQGEGLILLVDDESVMRTVGTALLEDCGYDVLVAENGQVAVEMYEKNRDTIDLVILDMIMPVMNGLDCFIALRKMRNDLPIVLASGFASTNDLDALKEQGCNAVIRKPYNALKLSQVLSDVLQLSHEETSGGDTKSQVQH